MSTEDDFEDALRCITQIKHHENIFRLSIRVDDSLTPKSLAKKKQCIVKDPFSNNKISIMFVNFKLQNKATNF